MFPDGTETGSSVMTGFFWRSPGSVYIISNWHNVTGLNSQTGEPLGTFTPSHFVLDFKFTQPAPGEGKVNIGRRNGTIPLHGADEQKIWLEHPAGRDVDVVAIPIDEAIYDGVQINCMNENDFENRWSPEIASDCFVVGFPEGMAGQHMTPIWKRASIATEPSLDHNERPSFLVDTLGNPGLSGSPVIARASGIFDIGSGNKPISPNAIIGSWENFVGIYSGRIGDEGVSFQLGCVWKGSVIEEIIGAHI